MSPPSFLLRPSPPEHPLPQPAHPHSIFFLFCLLLTRSSFAAPTTRVTVQCTLEHRLGRLGTLLPSPSNSRQPLRARSPSLPSILCFNSFSAFLCNRYCSPPLSLRTLAVVVKGVATCDAASLHPTPSHDRQWPIHRHHHPFPSFVEQNCHMTRVPLLTLPPL